MILEIQLENNVIKSKLKMRVDKMNCNNQLLGATKYEISTENSTVENAHIVEISTEKLTTENENIVEKGSEIMKYEISTEKLIVENIVETGSEMINVDDPGEVGQRLKNAKVNDEFEIEKSVKYKSHKLSSRRTTS